MEQITEQFGSIYIRDIEAPVVSWAQATTSKLPRELRDLVYQHLWAGTNVIEPVHDYRNHRGLFLNCPPPWLTAGTANMDFAIEAFEWYFVHGCLGREIDLTTIKRFLQTPYPMMSITPGSCKMRSLNIRIFSETPAAELESLFLVNHSDAFELNVRISVLFASRIRLSWFTQFGPELAQVAQTFRAKGCKFGLSIEFRQTGPINRRTLRWRQSTASGKYLGQYLENLPSWSPFLHCVEGQVAEKMLIMSKDALQENLIAAGVPSTYLVT